MVEFKGPGATIPWKGGVRIVTTTLDHTMKAGCGEGYRQGRGVDCSNIAFFLLQTRRDN